jgi:hypothetical protein
VAGVFIVAISPEVLGTRQAAAAIPTSLAQVFSLADNFRGLIAAGVFGLAPELLFRWLHGQADSIKEGLETTEASGGNGSSKDDCDDGGGSGADKKKKAA